MKKDLNNAIKLAGKVADNWLPLKIQYDHTPGTVVCIAVGGVPKYVSAFGYADMENNKKMQLDSQFRVASMSKMFTAVAILQLKEKGLLRLDDTITSYLAWFKGKQGKVDLANVTIRQILSHNSGLFRDGTAKQWVTDKFPNKLDKTVDADSIIFENGTTLSYSNHGYSILGELIEKISGKTYEDYVTDNIIKSLGLKNTFPDLPDDRPAKLAYGYSRYLPDKPEQIKEKDIKTYAYAPATGFVSDVKDLAKFLASLHLDSKKTVLSRESKKEMMRIQNITDDYEDFYGLGLDLHRDAGQLTYGHSGGFAGYTTNAISEPESNVQVIVLSNTISNTSWAVSNNLMRVIFKIKSMPDVTYIKDEPYSGTYRCRWGDATVVSLGKNLVEFGASAQNPVKAGSILEGKKKHVFQDTNKSGFGAAGETIYFSKIKDGKAQVMSNNGMILERII